MKNKTLKITQIIPDPEQPRKFFPEVELSELISSIKKQGILTPLIVESNYRDDKYLLIDGERRLRCLISLNIETAPVEIIEGPLTYEERTTKRFHIQEQHSNWSELDKARAIYEYHKTTGKSITKIAYELNIHIPKVHAYLSVTAFTQKANDLINKHKIDFTNLIFLIRVVKYYLSITNFTQEQIEEKLINKIISGIFKKVTDLQLFSKMINKKGFEDIKKEFLLNDDFSFEDFKEKTTLNEKGDAYKYKKNLLLFNDILIEIYKKMHLLDDTHKSLLIDIRRKLDKIINNN